MPKSLVKARNNACIRQSSRCYYCQVLMAAGDISQFAQQHGLSERQAKRLLCTAEHLLARCDGGLNCRSNIVAACLHCNSLRHKQPNPPDPFTFKIHVQRKMAARRWHQTYVFEKMITHLRWVTYD